MNRADPPFHVCEWLADADSADQAFANNASLKAAWFDAQACGRLLREAGVENWHSVLQSASESALWFPAVCVRAVADAVAQGVDLEPVRAQVGRWGSRRPLPRVLSDMECLEGYMAALFPHANTISGERSDLEAFFSEYVVTLDGIAHMARHLRDSSDPLTKKAWVAHFVAEDGRKALYRRRYVTALAPDLLFCGLPSLT